MNKNKLSFLFSELLSLGKKRAKKRRKFVISDETAKFQKVLSEQNYADVIKVFNEKGIAKSIGQYFNINNSSYCTTVISLLNGSKHNDIVDALLPYFPTEIPR